MASLQQVNDRSEIEQISAFKSGYQAVLENQQNLVQNTLNLLSSGILTADDRNCLQNVRSDMDQALRDIQKIIRQAITDISPANLEKEAQRDYHNLFTGDSNPERLAFIVFLKSYVVLKKFAMDSAHLWSNLQRLADQGDFSQSSEFRRQLYNYNLRPGIKQVETINLFCKRMASILRLKRDPLNTRQIDGLAIYAPEINYKLSYVFTENLIEHIDLLFESHEPDEQQLAESPAGVPATPDNISGTAPEFDMLGTAGKAIAPGPSNFRLDASGTQGWNRTPGYFFHYDPRLLERERESYKNVVYMDTHMGADQRYIKSDLIINISRKKQASENLDVEANYTDFLQNFFNLVVEITMMNMGISADLRYPFFFHLGPQTFYNLTIKFLQEVKTGTIHRKIQSGKMIKKHIPVELVRKSVLEWWQREILTRDNFDRDDYVLYKRIAAQVKKMHQELLQRAQLEYEKLPEDVRKARSRQDLFKENAMNWIGSTNVVIFKRFLKKSK